MSIGACIMIIHCLCVVAGQVVFGELTAVFAAQQFPDNCSDQQQNSTTTGPQQYLCHTGIELSVSDDSHLPKLCVNSTMLVSPSLRTIPSMMLFGSEVRRLVYRLF
ncbi:unnamed protein product, partial [Adineta ricciae]